MVIAVAVIYIEDIKRLDWVDDADDLEIRVLGV